MIGKARHASNTIVYTPKRSVTPTLLSPENYMRNLNKVEDKKKTPQATAGVNQKADMIV